MIKKQNTDEETINAMDTTKTVSKTGKQLYKKNHKYFIPHARLKIGQRKYCHCIMKNRLSKKKHKKHKKHKKQNPYIMCKMMKLNDRKTNPNDIQYDYKLSKTNCVMNYDYDDYSLEEVRAFCLEKKIAISYNKIIERTTKTIYYDKNKLVEKLIQSYLNKRKQKTNKIQRKTKNLKKLKTKKTKLT